MSNGYYFVVVVVAVAVVAVIVVVVVHFPSFFHQTRSAFRFLRTKAAEFVLAAIFAPKARRRPLPVWKDAFAAEQASATNR